MLGHNKAFNRDLGGSSSPIILPPTVPNTPSTNLQTQVVSGEVLGYPRAVMLVNGKVYLFQPSTASWNSMLGITIQSVLANVNTSIVVSGKIVYTGWGLVPNQVQYANVNGIISNIPLAGLGNMQPVGIALDADTLLLKTLNSIEVV